MGNVQASSNLPPMPPNMTPVPPPTTPQKLPPEQRIENPGSVEELHKKCKGTVFGSRKLLRVRFPSVLIGLVDNRLSLQNCFQ